MISKSILEEAINLKDTNHVCAPIIAQYQALYQIENDDFEFAHVVYGIKNKPVLFHINFSNNAEVSTKNEFSKHLQNLNQKSFYQLLYMVTYYGFFKEDEDDLSFIKDNNSTGAVASYLESTNGKLLYHYQLEQLYLSLTQSNIEDAIEFRKAINIKRHSAFEKARTMFLPSGESLLDVLTKYRHRDFTLYPKIKEALNLFNYLNT